MAQIGFKAPLQDPLPGSAHILLLLATEAWNREALAVSRHAPAGQLSQLAEKMRAELSLSQAELEKQLISTDWETIIEMMQVYKRRHFP